ncbi:MAG: hypothetical protein DME61_11520 [Verrucomicrobia bacterium]|nr:MAG: hypothetical protein DME61_11520 [Verrucomicrobiota bacterium]
MSYFLVPLASVALALGLFLQAQAVAECNQDELTRVETIRNDNNDPRERSERMNWTRQGVPDRATIVVTLPEDARLTFDGEATVSIGSSRLFITPPLKRGRDFHYALEARVMRNGKAETSSKQITVRAGEETRIGLLLGEDRRVAATGKPETKNRK